MKVTFTTDDIIVLATVIGALATIFGVVFAVYRWYLKQNKQSEDIERLHTQHCKDMAEVKSENALIIYGLFACLDGLQQLGCNHTVTEVYNRINKYINIEAHKYKEE